MANYKKSVKVRVKPAGPWNKLQKYIGAYAIAVMQESWKGGGDPDDIDILEARLDLARAELTAHINWMRRNVDEL